jgi:hypothetical protein
LFQRRNEKQAKDLARLVSLSLLVVCRNLAWEILTRAGLACNEAEAVEGPRKKHNLRDDTVIALETSRRTMAQVIEFYVPAHFTKRAMWVPHEKRGKVIPFRTDLDEITLGAEHQPVKDALVSILLPRSRRNDGKNSSFNIAVANVRHWQRAI